jgi:transposase-like protein
MLLEEDEQKIIDLYAEHPSMEKISEATGVSVRHIKRLLDSRKLFRPRRLVSPEEREEMVKLYQEGLSTWDIAKKFGYLNVCVINNLKKNGLKLRDRSTAAKTYSVNQAYFEKIDTPNKAYILGLSYADGNMSKDSFTLALKASDKPLLEAIKSEIGSTGPLSFRKTPRKEWEDMWALRIYDKFFCSFLREKGVIERKTSELSFPTFLGQEFYVSFLRGLTDGDGCISHGDERLKWRVSLAGSPQMMLDVKEILYQHYSITSHFKDRKGSKGCTLRFTVLDGLKFMNLIYSDPDGLRMDRKYQKYKTIITTISKRSKHKINGTLEEIEKGLSNIEKIYA